MAKKFLILPGLILFSILVQAQKSPAKFGKIDEKDFADKICPIDSNAHAYFIFDYGNSYFEYADKNIRSDDMKSDRKGFQLYFTRHFRIKIVDNEGFSWGNIEIPLYHDENEEKISKLRAFTYNLENGKIVKTKLERDGILIEETSKYWNTTKLAMPNVREGSIIEIEYNIISDFYFNLREWYFQKSIPVMQSEYHVSIPEYFHYNQKQKGYYPLSRANDRKNKELTITYREKTTGLTSGGSQSYTNTINYLENISHYSAEKIPVFPKEDYLRTADNYLTKIEFELQSTKFPNQIMYSYTTSWEKINENLMESYSFGKELDKSGHIKDVAEMLKNKEEKDIDLMSCAFEHIKNKLVWNGYYNKYVTSSLSRAYKDGGGNCADVNLNLVLLLNELGFESYPVVLSTQKHGIIHPSHPSISSFDYVIAMVRHEDKIYLMDATDKYSEINLLPTRCLNDKGRIISEIGGDWINLMDIKTFGVMEVFKISFDDDFSVNVEKDMKLLDYAAYHKRKEIKQYNNLEEYQDLIEKRVDNSTVENLEVKGLDTLTKNLYISYDIEQENYVDATGEIAFFSPAYNPFISSNPFKLEKREYPVEFNYPYTIQQSYLIMIPEKYEISELPKPIVARLPDNKGSYIYSINQMGNTVNLSVVFRLNKSFFLPDEYETLKNFYQLIVDKQKELIVLKPVG